MHWLVCPAAGFRLVRTCLLVCPQGAGERCYGMLMTDRRSAYHVISDPVKAVLACRVPRFVKAMMMVVATLKQQHQPILGDRIDACQGRRTRGYLLAHSSLVTPRPKTSYPSPHNLYHLHGYPNFT